MSFGLWTRAGPRNHVFGGSPESPTGMDNFWERGAPCDAVFSLKFSYHLFKISRTLATGLQTWKRPPGSEICHCVLYERTRTRMAGVCIAARRMDGVQARCLLTQPDSICCRLRFLAADSPSHGADTDRHAPSGLHASECSVAVVHPRL